MPKPTCADAVVKALEAEGVEHLFIGPPGEHVVELYDAILDSKQIKGYLTTNEYTLSFMADGYSRATGKTGVFTLIPGPGVTNALTGITEAFTDSSPVVGIISDVRANIEEDFQLHQIPNLEVLRPVIKKGYRIENPSQVSETFAAAFRLAQEGQPGPVMIEIPCDIYPMNAEEKPSSASPMVQTTNNREAIKGIAEILRNSSQCGIYIGRGCFRAGEEIQVLSEYLQAPLASSVNGRGIIPEDFPLSVGFGFGTNGSKIAQEVFKDCDTVLAVGCKFGEVSTGGYSFKLPKRLIHVDIDPKNLNRVFKTQHTLASDAKIFLRELISELANGQKPKNEKLLKKIHQGKEEFYSSLLHGDPETDSVDPGKFYVKLREKMGRQDTLTVDIGNHELWAISCFQVLSRGTFLCPTNFSAMGFAIPAAIAAQLARPQHRAVCCVGDGGFLMSGFEILTAVRYKLPVIFCVFNDGAFGITKGLQERIFKRPAFVNLRNPDFKMIAESFGLPYLKLARDDEISSVLDKAFSLQQPVLIELIPNYREMSPFLKGIVRHRIKVASWRDKIFALRRLIRRSVWGVEQPED